MDGAQPRAFLEHLADPRGLVDETGYFCRYGHDCSLKCLIHENGRSLAFDQMPVKEKAVPAGEGGRSLHFRGGFVRFSPSIHAT
jgi:hypothetical protein